MDHAYPRILVPNTTHAWVLTATLEHEEAVYPQHRFATRGALSIDQDVAVVGAHGLECVFLYRRFFRGDTGTRLSRGAVPRSMTTELGSHLSCRHALEAVALAS